MQVHQVLLVSPEQQERLVAMVSLDHTGLKVAPDMQDKQAPQACLEDTAHEDHRDHEALQVCVLRKPLRCFVLFTQSVRC